MRNQQEEASTMDAVQYGTNLLQLIMFAWAAAIEPFVRRNFGCWYFGPWRWSGLVVLSLFAALTTPPTHILPFNVHFYALIVLMLWHRLRAVSRRRNPDAPHSHYNGWPLLCDLVPFSESFVKQYLEPMLVAIGGLVIAGVGHQPFGLFILMGGVCMMLIADQHRGYRMVRSQQVRDAMIEQDLMAEDCG